MQVGVGVILRGSLTTNFEFLNTGLCWLGGGCCRYIIMPLRGPTSKIAKN